MFDERRGHLADNMTVRDKGHRKMDGKNAMSRKYCNDQVEQVRERSKYNRRKNKLDLRESDFELMMI